MTDKPPQRPSDERASNYEPTGVLVTTAQVTETIDRAALVAELRRQVADRQPEDDTKPWSVAFLNLAESLEGGWLGAS